jgi:hypothetical protein
MSAKASSTSRRAKAGRGIGEATEVREVEVVALDGELMRRRRERRIPS